MTVALIAGISAFCGAMAGALFIIILWGKANRANAECLRLLVLRHSMGRNQAAALSAAIIRHAAVLEGSDAT